jgi:hypothetical protein
MTLREFADWLDQHRPSAVQLGISPGYNDAVVRTLESPLVGVAVKVSSSGWHARSPAAPRRRALLARALRTGYNL